MREREKGGRERREGRFDQLEGVLIRELQCRPTDAPESHKTHHNRANTRSQGLPVEPR